jgi:hypothetical protein
MRNIAAIAIKKFLIWKAIVVNVASTHSDPEELAVKKNPRIGPVKLSRRVLELLVVPILLSLTLISLELFAELTLIIGAADTYPDTTKRDRKTRKIRIYIKQK